MDGSMGEREYFDFVGPVLVQKIMVREGLCVCSKLAECEGRSVGGILIART